LLQLFPAKQQSALSSTLDAMQELGLLTRASNDDILLLPAAQAAAATAAASDSIAQPSNEASAAVPMVS